MIVKLHTTTSTMKDAAALASRSEPHGTAVIADLQTAGIPVHFVGSSDGIPSPDLIASANTASEGHSGYRIRDIINDLDGDVSDPAVAGDNGGYWFSRAEQPDIILLHIGSNDMIHGVVGGLDDPTTASGRLDTLIGKIFQLKPNVKLVVSTLIPVNTTPQQEALLVNYNNAIRTQVVPKYQAAGYAISLVDMYAQFVNPDGSLKPGLIGDGVHPTPTGYDLMADTWASAVEPLYTPE